MLNMQFWRSFSIYNGVTITTYYLVENDTYYFLTSNIFDVIAKLNERLDEKNSISMPVSKSKIRVFQNNIWETVDVLTKDDIFEVTSSNSFFVVKCFEGWIKKLCSKVPDDCILSENSKEYEFLNLATNRFMDLYEQINNRSFMDLSPEIRLHKIKDLFCVYTELLSYPPIKKYIDFVEKTRPPMESVIVSELVKFIRNILSHFPFFTTWNEIYISKQLINWDCEGRSIDKFLKKYQGHEDVRYRFKINSSGEWGYPTIKFPKVYNDDKIFLKDIINEREGILLCVVLMFKVVSSQIIYKSEL